jgi:hypothetical protein
MFLVKELTQLDIKELITYYPVVGKAYWNYRDVKWFKASEKRSAQHICNLWNSNNAKKEITSLGKFGYIQTSLLGEPLLLHRVIWFYMTGEWPKGEIDHINGNTIDNRWENLRDVTHINNCRNQRIRKNNKSGVPGVYWHKASSKWGVNIIDNNGKQIDLGYFNNFEEAIVVRKSAEEEYGYHPNHGRN